MIVKLVVPVIDTESINCDSNVNMTDDEYGDMVYDAYKKYDRAIDAYTRGKAYYQRGIYDIDDRGQIKENSYDEIECECQIMDVKKQEITYDWLDEHLYNGKMAIIIININPSDIDLNVESEIRYWKDDSERLLNDALLDDTAKLKYLPTRTFKLRTEEREYTIENCKLVENRSNENFPYCFVIIIEKIK